MRLLHYTPMTEKTYPTPLLIVFALLNRYYIMDIQPDKSIIRNLLQQGFDIYTVDWAEPTRAQRFVGLDEYVNDYIGGAVNFIRKEAGVDAISLQGYCMGGSLSVMYTALHPETVRNLIIQAAPIDFNVDSGLLNLWVRDIDVDKLVDTYGNVPGDLLNVGFMMRNPFELMFDKYVSLMDHASDRKFVEDFYRMEHWIYDNPSCAGEVFREFVKYGYQQNLLVKGKLKVGNERVNLKQITQPLLNIVAEKDDLVPPEMSIPLNDLVSSKDKTLFKHPSGHIGLSVSSRALQELWPKVGKWLAKRSTTEK
jgi:poly[(R)-3-hydroxyalkanoate] polymerase subunit PhaC